MKRETKNLVFLIVVISEEHERNFHWKSRLWDWVSFFARLLPFFSVIISRYRF